ncbi:MAG: AraC family transcriptional regulator [Clostridium sp.]|nr:AraC family transcriptional regulator [Clostridium sp.]
MAVSKCVSLISLPNRNVSSSDMLPHIDESGLHGTADFPVAIYNDDVTANAVNWHWHEEFEIGFVTDGTIRLECGNRRYVLSAGDIFFINSNVLHSMSNDNPSNKATFKAIVFHGLVIGGNENSIFYQKYLLPILNNNNFRDIALTVNSSRYQNIFSLLNVVWDSICSETPDYEITVRNELSNLFCILNHLPESNIPVQTEHNFIQESRVQILLAYIHQHYFENFTLDVLAKSASISKSETLRCFKGIVGQSPIKYLKTYRLQSAAHMIRNTDYSIGTIGELCGFSDNSYFSKSFKEIYHCTPHEYKRALAKKG